MLSGHYSSGPNIRDCLVQYVIDDVTLTVCSRLWPDKRLKGKYFGGIELVGSCDLSHVLVVTNTVPCLKSSVQSSSQATRPMELWAATIINCIIWHAKEHQRGYRYKSVWTWKPSTRITSFPRVIRRKSVGLFRYWNTPMLHHVY